MTQSILTSVKQALGITEEYDVFDSIIMMHINSVFMVLHQLGVGPLEGFRVESKSNTWDEFVDDEQNLDAVRSYMYLKVKHLFDPPTGGAVMESNKQLLNELEFRLNVQAETK